MTTMPEEATAFAPGHITGFFEIRDEAADPAQMGSRGAGFSVELGVRSRVWLEEGVTPGVEVLDHGRPIEASTTRRAVEFLLGDSSALVHVDQTMELPVSQGFGMSSAGALSACLALAKLLDRPRREAVWAAHCAEVVQRTGLGDVVGAAAGGFEVRVKPGCEPYGEVRAWSSEAAPNDVLLAVVSPAVSTKKVLADPARRREIDRVGGALVDAFVGDPSLSAFVDASRRFATETRLATAEILQLWDSQDAVAGIGQCQLGGSVFAFGASASVENRLRSAGPTFRTTIDRRGARLLEGPQP